MRKSIDDLPFRGEVWNVDFNPTRGAEIRKVRPAVVINTDALNALPLRMVAPVTGWNEHRVDSWWFVRLDPDEENGLEKVSCANCLQVRSVGLERFGRKWGHVTPAKLEEIVTAVAGVIEYN